MADYQSAGVQLLKHEGGYQDNPADPGNYDVQGNLIGTNFGITPGTYKRYYGSYPSKTDMKNLTYNEAYDIYRGLYWDKNQLYFIQDQAAANQVLDTLVLHGRGARLIQVAINDLNYPVAINNFYNNETAQAVIDLTKTPGDAQRFNDTLVNVRIAYVTDLAAMDPSLNQFLDGWKSRIYNFYSGTKPIKLIVVGVLLSASLLIAFPQVRQFLRLPF